IDTILRAPPNADDATAADADVQTTAIRAEDARRLHPALWLLGDVLVHPRRPRASTCERRALAPDLSSSLSALHRSHSDYPAGSALNACVLTNPLYRRFAAGHPAPSSRGDRTTIVSSQVSLPF